MSADKLAVEYMVLTCVYCVKEYPQGTPTSSHEVLTEHIRQCEKHPLKRVSDEIAKLRRVLAEVSSLAHAGGLRFYSMADCLTEIRRLTVDYWDKAVNRG